MYALQSIANTILQFSSFAQPCLFFNAIGFFQNPILIESEIDCPSYDWQLLDSGLPDFS
jgi:hypothetical protein